MRAIDKIDELIAQAAVAIFMPFKAQRGFREMSNQPPPGDSASVSVDRPHASRMGEFLPLWNKRNAHIEARDQARTRREVLAAEGNADPDRLKELDDVAATHDAEAQACTAAMKPLSQPLPDPAN
jgi:hypothetical protein